MSFEHVEIRCSESLRDYMVFSYEPGATDGLVAGIAFYSADESITMGMDDLIRLRDACNTVIASHE